VCDARGLSFADPSNDRPIVVRSVRPLRLLRRMAQICAALDPPLVAPLAIDGPSAAADAWAVTPRRVLGALALVLVGFVLGVLAISFGIIPLVGTF